jgi:conjugative transfer signal peptidase TraF
MTRWPWTLITCLAVLLVVVPAVCPSVPRLMWNASASAPIGLYRILPASTLHVGELVVVRPPGAIVDYLAERGYLARGVPLLKHILALPGQNVCRSNRTISVDGKAVGQALDADRAGRELPTWQGCRTLTKDEVFFMNGQSEYSFDGRYFGPLPASTIVGHADPIWLQKNH